MIARAAPEEHGGEEETGDGRHQRPRRPGPCHGARVRRNHRADASRDTGLFGQLHGWVVPTRVLDIVYPFSTADSPGAFRTAVVAPSPPVPTRIPSLPPSFRVGHSGPCRGPRRSPRGRTTRWRRVDGQVREGGDRRLVRQRPRRQDLPAALLSRGDQDPARRRPGLLERPRRHPARARVRAAGQARPGRQRLETATRATPAAARTTRTAATERGTAIPAATPVTPATEPGRHVRPFVCPDPADRARRHRHAAARARRCRVLHAARCRRPRAGTRRRRHRHPPSTVTLACGPGRPYTAICRARSWTLTRFRPIRVRPCPVQLAGSRTARR